MTGSDKTPPDRDELRRRVKAMIADLDPAQLPSLLDDIGRRAIEEHLRPSPGQYRKERLAETVVFRVRMNLDQSRPPIWRRFDLRSDVTLDDVHRVIQAAFGWLDYHLYRFALGGNPFDRSSELFLCPFDVEEGEETGTPVADVRLDETLHEPGDVLRYVYDYGDSWELTLKLESVGAATEDTPPAWCVGGRRAAPPEDCGGLTDGTSLKEILDDPAHFDVDEVNSALDDPFRRFLESGVNVRLGAMLYRLAPSDTSGDLRSRVATLLSDSEPVPTKQFEADLHPYFWFLRRARDDGFDLTSAGYLKPADVVAASEVLPTMQHWIGTKNREIQSTPVLYFREDLQRIGLLRKYKGQLLPTKVGKSLADDPEKLADFLAARFVPDDADQFTTEATLLVLFFAATSRPGDELPLDEIAVLLTDLDWRHPNGAPIKGHDLHNLGSGALDVFANVSEPRRRSDEVQLSATAVAIARRAIGL